MSSKRSNGEGTIYKNHQRNRYEGQIMVGTTPAGRPIRKKVTGRTRREVAARIIEVKNCSTYGTALPSAVTVAEWLNHWLDTVLPLANLAPSTVESYQSICGLYLIPHLGRIRLAKLTPAHVRSMLKSLDDDGYSGNTQRLARATLRRSLRTAEAEGYVPKNVATMVDGVKVKSKQGRTLHPEEVRALLVSAKGDRIEPVLHVMLSLGLRRSEALGLCWCDLDLNASPPKVHVRHALKRLRTGLILGEPKTERTKRLLVLPEATAKLLRDHRKLQMEERLLFGPGWGGNWTGTDFVFTTPIGTPLDPSNFRHSLERVTERAGLGVWTPHELRHTAASLMIASGVALKQVSEALGHSSIAITADVYGHLLAPSTATADAMAAVMYGT